ncbi:phage uncharacterized protein, C-terminal domain [Mycobacteroides abscessus subsp. abscessus]|nr:phage uncharacterized protein, C-terminal domain [Mycobacteroides abscessus subsp. abscessus]
MDNQFEKLSEKEIKQMFKYLRKHFNDEDIANMVSELPFIGENGIRRTLAEIDIEYCALVYLSDHFDKPFSRFHTDLLEQVSKLNEGYSCQTKEEQEELRRDKTGQKLLCIAPRGNGKSRIVNILLNTYNLLFKKSPFIVCISASDDLAKSFLDQIKYALEFNENILEDFGHLKGSTWNATQIELTNGTCLIAKGIKSKLRGLSFNEWRATTIVLDDIESDSSANSEISTEEIKYIFNSTIMSMGDRYSDVVFLGTIISEMAHINELYKTGTGWKKLFYKSVYSFSESPLWEEWEKIYTELENPNCIEDARAFFEQNKEEMLKGTEVLWEEKNDYYFLMRKRLDDGVQSFYSEQQNDPRSSSDYVFQKMSYWDELPPIKDLDLVLGVDPSLGGKKSDFSAICLMGKHKQTGYKYVIDGQLHKVKPKELLEIIINMCEENTAISKIAFESIAFQEYLATDLKDKIKEKELYHIIVDGVKPRTNKHNRIVNLEPFVTRGEIKFNKDAKRFNTQVHDYNINARNDDAPDVLQLCFEAVEKIKKPKKVVQKPKWL